MKIQTNNFDFLDESIKEAMYLINKIQPDLFNIKGKLITLPADKETIIVGDLHGDLKTFLKILEKSKFQDRIQNGDEIYLICLGDYIDRGPKQVELMQCLLGLVINYPRNVILLRGNHEGPREVKVNPHDFLDHLKSRYKNNWMILHSLCRDFFDELYTGCYIEDRALLLHGGIPTNAKGLENIAHAHSTHPNNGDLIEILWNDPSEINGINSSRRGIGKQFGVDIVTKFMSEVGFEMLIRGHSCFHQGYQLQSSKILTLFSCKIPVYMNKYAAYLHIKFKENFKKSLSKFIYKI